MQKRQKSKKTSTLLYPFTTSDSDKMYFYPYPHPYTQKRKWLFIVAQALESTGFYIKKVIFYILSLVNVPREKTFAVAKMVEATLLASTIWKIWDLRLKF